MNKNDIYEIQIDDIGNDGEGIGHIADRQNGRCFAVFVKDAIVGDVAEVKIIKVKKSYAYGRLMRLIKPSSHRVEAVCKNARACGGCSLMHMSYERQLRYKLDKVKSCMKRIGGIENADDLCEGIYGMDEPYHFRNKMQFPVGVDKDGNIKIGFYATHTHSIVDLDSCAIAHPVNDYIVKHLRSWLEKWYKQNKNLIYQEESHTGLVRHILTRVGFKTKELMVCLVINGTGLDKSCREELVAAVKAATNEYGNGIKVTGISLNFNTEKTNRILGDTCATVYGQDYITDYIGDVSFRISPLSFYQVNPVQTEKLYSKAIEYADLKGDETVWDLYCGIGTISLSLAGHVKQVYGVEIVPQAIEDAKINAKINNIENATFFCGKAEELVPKFYERQAENTDTALLHPDVIIVDPPRKGCDSVLLDTILKASPDRLVYVSCDPATLARDIKYLGEGGYTPDKIAVYDQFGHSGHVETVVLMSKVNTVKG